jgi:hypothetical protein
METLALNTEQRITLVAERILMYYMQIIAHQKKNNITSFVIDSIPSRDCNMSKVALEDKYDGKSNWRDVFGMLDDTAEWHTLGSEETAEFRDMGLNENGAYFINMEEVLQKVSLLLSKKGIANYLDQPTDDLFKKYFYKSDKAWLFIVL